MKVIAVTNAKGGVGKTITAVCLAAALETVYKQRVLLIDSDPQGSATKHLLGRGFEIDEHLGRALIDRSFNEVIVDTPSGLRLVPADIRLGNSVDIIEDLNQWSFRLKQSLVSIEADFDYVVIDCPPSLKTFTIMALVAADAYLIPTEPEELAVDGVEKITDLADHVAASANVKLKKLGIVVTRYHKKLRNAHHDKMITTLRAQYGEQMMLPSIRRDKTVLDAVSQATTIFHVNARSNAAQDYSALAEAVLARL